MTSTINKIITDNINSLLVVGFSFLQAQNKIGGDALQDTVDQLNHNTFGQPYIYPSKLSSFSFFSSFVV